MAKRNSAEKSAPRRFPRCSAAEIAGEAAAQPTGRRLRTYVRVSILDFLLVLIVSSCLAMTVSFAFESAPDLRGNALLVAGLCAPELLILFFGGTSRRAVLPSAILTCIWVAIVIAVACFLTAPTPLFVDGALNDVAESYLPFAVVIAVVPILAYLLSRRALGMVFLLLLSVLSCSWVQFLYRDWSDSNGFAIAIVAYAALAMLFVYQTYRSSVLSAKRVKKTSFIGVFAYAAVIALACAGLALAVFFCIVQPAGLKTFDLRPFQEYYSMPIEQYAGVYDKQQVENPDDTTNKTDDEMKDSNKNAEGGPEKDQDDQPQPNPLSNVQQFLSQFSPDSWDQEFDGVNYDQLKLGAFLVALAIAAVVAAAIAARRHIRKRRLAKWSELAPKDQIRQMYDFFCNRFGKMKIERAETLTPMEFALASQRRLAEFSEGTGGVNFVRITDIYQRSNFGVEEPSAEELADVKAYYGAFFKNARHQVGNLKWIWKFWRI